VSSATRENQDAIALRTSRPQSLIFTIYGAYSRSLGGWIAVATLLKLLREMDIEGNAVRSALSRLKRRGVLISESRGGFVGYALSESARRAFDIGDARVLERRHPDEQTRWILVAFSIPEKSRDLRYRLRSRLTGVGFGQVTGGLWIAPASLRADAALAIDSLGIGQYVHLFEADHLNAHSPDSGSVDQWWDLPAIEEKYAQFIHAFSEPRRTFETGSETATPENAFRNYTQILTAWRPLPYLDPGLPGSHLPTTWNGTTATQLFFYFHDLMAAPAQAHVRASADLDQRGKKVAN
jgi:phenylacetic acid degradation operon negative regulatory protein